MKAQDDTQNPSGSHISSIQRPTAKYNRLSNTVRQITPGPWQCAMFCGGKNCKYDNPAKWSESEMALNGLYSSWVGDNILAIARPSSETIEKFSIVEQFQQHGIKSVINLQRPGEHSSCGNPLQSSGFSYQPEEFMDNNIFFYNFGWDDYGIRSLPSILDMVKVMSFALQQGKVAVHCHAGLGRTGVLIACYLIYEQRLEGDNAIQFVREKRLGSIQTPGQIECCQQFAKFLIPFRVIFSSCDPCAYPFTLDQFLIRQKLMLHGYEARELKYIPKIVRVVCNQLAQLAQCVSTTQPKLTNENMDLLKKTAPGAFPSQRHLQNPPQSPRDKRQSAFGYNSVAHPNILPPLRKRSSSAEDLTQDAAYGSQSSLGVPQPSGHGLMGRRSPMLDTRKNITDGSVASSSDDDHSVMAETSQLAPQQSVSFAASRSKPQSAKRNSSGGKLTAVLNRSITMLSSLLIDDPQDMDDVQLVGTAMAFDASSSGFDPDELNRVSQSLQLRVDSLQHNLNRSASAWKIVLTEEDPFVLSVLMWSWLEHLEKPILSKTDIMKLKANFDEDDPAAAFKILNRGVKQTLDCILKTVCKLPLQPHLQELEDSILARLIKAVTHIPAAHLLGQECSIDERGEDSEDEDDLALFDLLMMLKLYVKYVRSSGTEDNFSLCSQDSSLLSLSSSLSKSSASREVTRAALSNVKGALPKEVARETVPRETKQPTTDITSPRDAAGISNSALPQMKSPRVNSSESSSIASQSVILPGDGLQRRKLKALDKPLAKKAGNSDDLAPLPRKNALPPIF